MNAQYLHTSAVGPIYFVASQKGLVGAFWHKQKLPVTQKLDRKIVSHETIIRAIVQMDEYLNGKRKDFDLSFDIQGTDFQKRVWNELKNIPYGQTVSYTHIAKKIKQEKAVRAVGTANGRNPLSIIVPCHRVIASDGTLGGYNGGLAIKTKLLDLERQTK